MRPRTFCEGCTSPGGPAAADDHRVPDRAAVRLRQESTRNLLDDWKRLRDLERELVMRALHEAGGTQARAAASLGITPRQFAYKMKKYRIIKEFRIEG
ncbi:MAG TPA: helix-turn-helix domain-containing protein [Verrucomicrobiae bacterium]|nr:helix-turn-helix domain-containing protein [Verrucomicrobiae bacterium]